MSFHCLTLPEYLERHMRSNPSDDCAEIERLLRGALEDRRAGVTCDCGEPIWVIGSALAGNACFTCIAGEADPSEDLELSDE